MKKLYFIKEKTGKWNFCLVVNGKKVLNSAKQDYSRKIDCKEVGFGNCQWDEFLETTRKEFNKLFELKWKPTPRRF